MDKTKNIGKKIMVIAVALIMIFTVGLLGASCDDNPNPNPCGQEPCICVVEPNPCGQDPCICVVEPTLEERIDAIGKQVHAMQNSDESPSLADIDALLEYLTELRTDVEQLDVDNEKLLVRIDDYKNQLTLLAKVIEIIAQLDIIGEQVYAMQNSYDYPTLAEIDALLAEIEVLRADIVLIEGDNTALLARIDKYETQLKTLRNEVNILNAFDMTDPKDIWDGCFTDIQFELHNQHPFDVAISITFRRIHEGAEYPLIEARHLGLDNIRYFSFIQFPPCHWEDHWSPFRQRATLFLTVSNEYTFTAAIRHLETLCFVKSARPVNIIHMLTVD